MMAAQRGTWNKRSTDGERNTVASIHKELIVDAPADYVWAALKDYGAVHLRLFPTILIDSVMEGDSRIVTFANGLVARERLVDLDDGRRRVAYSASGGQLTYHHATMQVFDEGDGRSRLVWILDLQPEDAREAIQALVDSGSEIMQRYVAETYRQARIGSR